MKLDLELYALFLLLKQVIKTSMLQFCLVNLPLQW